MKRLLLALMLLAGQADAATLYVTVSGAGDHSGSTLGNAMTLAEAVGTTGSVNTFVMASGSYGALVPGKSGTDNLTRVRFIPSATSAVDTTVIVSSVTISSKNYVTISGIKVTGAVTINASDTTAAPQRDSVTACVINGGVNLWGAQSCLVDGNRITGTIYFQGNGGNGGYSGTTKESGFAVACQYDTLRNNMIWLTTGLTSSDYRVFQLRSHTQRSVITGNTVVGAFNDDASNASNPVMLWMMNARYNYFQGNTWRGNPLNAPSGSTFYGIYIRDSTYANRFVGDRFFLGDSIQHAVECDLGASGSFTTAGTSWGNQFIDCVFKTSSGLTVQSKVARSLTLQNTVVAARHGIPLTWSASPDSVRVFWTTLYAGGQRSMLTNSNDSLQQGRLTNNLYLSKGASTGTSATITRWSDGSIVTCNHDSTLFYSYGSDSCSSAMLQGGGGGSALKIGNVVAGCTAFSAARGEQNSEYINPGVTDTTWATLDLASSGSAGPMDWSNRWASSQAGANPTLSTYSGEGGGVTTPGTIVDLAASYNSLVEAIVEFTSIDDPDGSGSGTVASYDVRYRVGSTFVEGDWAGATQATGEPTPQAFDNVENFAVTVSLANSTQYTFAVKSTSSTGGVSAISNASTFTTPAASANALTATDVQVYANYTTAGVQVPFTGDADRDATVRLYTNVADSCGYADTCGSVASFCGSLFGLSPGTTYTVYADVVDADGGSVLLSTSFTTKTYPILAPTAYKYVDPLLGLDANPGTLASPKQTIQAAWDAAGVGEGVWMQAGTYYDTLLITTSNDGSAGNRKWLYSPANSAIMDGSDTAFLTRSTYDSLTLSGQKVYFIRGFTYWPRQVTYNNQYDLPRHQTLKSLYSDSMGVAAGYGWFRSNTGDTMYVQLPGGASPNGAVMNYARRNYLVYSTGNYLGIDGVVFRNAGCDFNTNNPANAGIRVGVVQFLGATDVVIDGCVFYSNGWCHVSFDSLLGAPTRDILITGNVMYSQGVFGWGEGTANIANNSVMHHPQIYVDASRGVVIESNTIRDFFDGAVRTASGSAGFIRDMDISSNAFYNFTSDGIELDPINGPNVKILNNVIHQGEVGFDLQIHGGPLYFIGNRVSRIFYAAIQTRGTPASDTLLYSGRQFWFHNTLLSNQWVMRSVGPVTRGLWFENNIFGSKTERTIYDANNAYYDYPANQWNWNLHLPSSNLLTVKATTYGLADTTTMRSVRTMERNGRFASASTFTFVDSANGNFRPNNNNSISKARGLPGINKTGDFRVASGSPDIGALEYAAAPSATTPTKQRPSGSGGGRRNRVRLR